MGMFCDGAESIANAPRVVELEPVSLNRKKSLNLSLTTWSNRTLVEFSELGLDQPAMYWANPFCSWPVGGQVGSVAGSHGTKTSGPFGTGKAFSVWLRGAGAADRKVVSGT